MIAYEQDQCPAPNVFSFSTDKPLKFTFALSIFKFIENSEESISAISLRLFHAISRHLLNLFLLLPLRWSPKFNLVTICFVVPVKHKI